MRSDLNGCSTTNTGHEKYEYYTNSQGEKRIQYDYRTPEGTLFSCVALSLKFARGKRDAWLDKKLEIMSAKTRP